MLSGSSPALCKRLMKASIWGVQPVGAADGMVVSGGGGGACDLRDAWGDLVKSEGILLVVSRNTYEENDVCSDSGRGA